jgi:hypothetical protein
VLIVVHGNVNAADTRCGGVKIYLLNSTRLAEDLAENKVTPYQQALYLLLGLVLYTLINYSTLIYSNASRTWIGLAELVCIVAVIVYGVLYAYKRNGGHQGERFVIRFICLFLPVSINVYIVVWGLYYLLGWWFKKAIYQLSFSSQEAADKFIGFVQQDLPWVITLVFVVLTQISIFWRIAHHMERISARKRGQGSQ